MINESFYQFGVDVLLLIGDDFSVVAAYDPISFKHRMTVAIKAGTSPVPEPESKHIQVQGLNAFKSAVYDIKPAVHYIRPDGNAENYRKGGITLDDGII